jgi:endonuclease/exonuclease/phosphatase family metal-dependent hydrolase
VQEHAHGVGLRDASPHPHEAQVHGSRCSGHVDVRLLIPVAAALTVTAMAGCLSQPRMAPYSFVESQRDCRSRGEAPESTTVNWISPADPTAREKVEEWCRSVGRVVVSATPSDTPSHDSSVLTVATWNMNVGAGDLVSFVERLRRGEFTAPLAVGDYAILLQETYRVGPEVPRLDTVTFRSPKRLGSADSATDIRHLAALLKLHLVYAPAMRNGNEEEGASDRGNAILSTLPLDEVTVIELPFERQRRVAIAATAHGTGSRNGSSSRRVRLVSTHFETRAGLTRGGPIAARLRQARALVEALAGDTAPLVIGGDFNTSYGTDEPAVHELQAAFPATSPTTWVTWRGPLGISARLDHMFARVSDQDLVVRRVPERFGSDHHPLVTVIVW